MMKYTFFKYDYGYKSEIPIQTANLGDNIQSLAALQFLPEDIRKQPFNESNMIDRDRLNAAENCKFIANGWYVLSDQCHLPHKDSKPLFVSFHINNTDKPDEFKKCIDYLKYYSTRSPIGCRDLATAKFLKGQGVNAYFSSCLTTTLTREDYINDKDQIDKNNQPIILADLSLSLLSKLNLLPTRTLKKQFSIKQRIRSTVNKFLKQKPVLLEAYDGGEVIQTSHEVPITTSQIERFNQARSLLTTYAQAKLVLTSRIHAALPCLGLETPVILIAPYDEKRYQGIDNLLNHIFYDPDTLNLIDVSITKDSKGNVINPDKYIGYRKDLINKCTTFFDEELK